MYVGLFLHKRLHTSCFFQKEPYMNRSLLQFSQMRRSLFQYSRCLLCSKSNLYPTSHNLKQFKSVQICPTAIENRDTRPILVERYGSFVREYRRESPITVRITYEWVMSTFDSRDINGLCMKERHGSFMRDSPITYEWVTHSGLTYEWVTYEWVSLYLIRLDHMDMIGVWIIRNL